MHHRESDHLPRRITRLPRSDFLFKYIPWEVYCFTGTPNRRHCLSRRIRVKIMKSSQELNSIESPWTSRSSDRDQRILKPLTRAMNITNNRIQALINTDPSDTDSLGRLLRTAGYLNVMMKLLSQDSRSNPLHEDP